MTKTDESKIHYKETDDEISLSFEDGIDPQILIDAIKKIDKKSS